MSIFCDQSQIWGKYIKEVGWRERGGKGKADFLWTISNMGKIHKRSGLAGKERLIFCGQSHIWGKYIKEIGWKKECGNREAVSR